MRKTNISILLVLFLLTTFPAYATNGMLIEGYDPISHAMGGASIAFDNGAGAMVNNPATLSLMSENGRFDLAIGVLNPNVKFHAGEYTFTSGSKSFYMPGLGYVKRSGNLTYGFGIYSQGGIGTDFLDSQNMFSQVMIGKAIVPISYAVNDKLSIGLSLQFLRAEMDLVMGPFDFKDSSNFSGATSGTGVSALAGLTYKVNDQVTIGASYQHKGNISDLTGRGARVKGMDMPASVGVGFAAKLSDKTLLAIDYKKVFWSNSMESISISQNGVEMQLPQYWDDQDILSIGLAYEVSDKWTVRAGASFSNNPVKENATPLFPAVTKNHYTMGFGYKFNERNSIDASFAYVPRVTVNNGLDFTGTTTSHSQRNFQLMYSYHF